MFTKVSPNHLNKCMDRIAGAIVDQAYLLKKSPRVSVKASCDDKLHCKVHVSSNFYLDTSVVEGIVKRIMGENAVLEYVHTLVDNYAGVACNKDCQVVVAYPKDAHRRAVSICNDIYESTGRITTCCFDYPVANVLTDELISDKDVKFTVNHNDIKIYYNNTTRVYGESNNEICSDIGNDGTTALHGKDLFNPEVTLAIYGCLKVESKGGEIQFSCHEGDISIGKMKYSLIVKRVKDYINNLGGFEKFAEWGYLRPLVRE